jgi:WD40 repeat protein
MRIIVAALLVGTVLSGVATAPAQDPQESTTWPRRRLSLPGKRIRQLHFSHDGRFLLAQDDQGITVLSVQPLSVLFRVPAANAVFSGFTPDSRDVLFLTFGGWVGTSFDVFPGPTAHLERWSVADRARVNSTEIPWAACRSWGLSPDGRYLACHDTKGTLSLVHVASSATIFQKKNFSALITDSDRHYLYSGNAQRGYLGGGEIEFSPDGRFVVAVPDDAYGSVFAWDLQQGKPVSLGLSLRSPRSFVVFIGGDQLLKGGKPSHGFAMLELVAFPSGKKLSTYKLAPPGTVHQAADPNFIIIRPAKSPFQVTNNYANEGKQAAALEFRTGQVLMCDAPALDVIGQYYAAERLDGELGLYERGKGLQATVRIPSSGEAK